MNASTQRGGYIDGAIRFAICRTENRRENLRSRHEQTETNPAQSRERLEDTGERDLDGGRLLLSGTAGVKFRDETGTPS